MRLLGQHVLVRHSRGHLLVGMGQVWLRCWLRGWGYLWVHSLRWHLTLRWPRRRAWHHLRVLLGHVALWSVVALGHLRSRLITVLLVWLQLTWERLLVLGRNTRLWGQICLWVALLSLDRRRSTSKSSGSRLVSLRQRLSPGLRVLLRLLLRLGCGRLDCAVKGHSWLGHKVRIGPHLCG